MVVYLFTLIRHLTTRLTVTTAAFLGCVAFWSRQIILAVSLSHYQTPGLVYAIHVVMVNHFGACNGPIVPLHSYSGRVRPHFRKQTARLRNIFHQLLQTTAANKAPAESYSKWLWDFLSYLRAVAKEPVA